MLVQSTDANNKVCPFCGCSAPHLILYERWSDGDRYVEDYEDWECFEIGKTKHHVCLENKRNPA